ncbi:precorrin-3B synthase [Sphaerisporangium rhizosphaerae]|uniref:Precorrin-3B synthase n=1 Tax=Sphaerisporangium rhizosphaerae TaxID=2269375 RepID=A0ABW2P5K5_9ACTN
MAAADFSTPASANETTRPPGQAPPGGAGSPARSIDTAGPPSRPADGAGSPSRPADGAGSPARSRPDACPGALQTHTAADGAVARLRTPGGLLTPDRLRVIADAATTWGSGVIELTSRANVQVRGLGEADGQAFADRMAAAGLLPSATHERVRNILAGPLSGLDGRGLADVIPLVRALDGAVLARPALAELPGRFLFALDDGRRDLLPLHADLTLLPTRPSPVTGYTGAGNEPGPGGSIEAWDPGQGAGMAGCVLLLAGQDTGLRFRLADAVPVMIAAAEAFLAERTAQGTGAWRVAELTDGPAAITARLTTGTPQVFPTIRTGPDAATTDTAGRTDTGKSPGIVAMADGRVALVVLAALGRLTAAQAHAVAEAADAGSAEVRLTPWRTLVIPGIAPAEAAAWTSRLATAGLVTDAASPWAGVTACTGLPGCAKSLADVRSDATRATSHSHPATGPALTGHRPLPVHWAGCERHCGRPAGPAVLVTATPDGYHVESPGTSEHHTALPATATAVAGARTGDHR